MSTVFEIIDGKINPQVASMGQKIFQYIKYSVKILIYSIVSVGPIVDKWYFV